MDKKATEKLKKELLAKSHDVFKNVQALFDLAYSTEDIDLCFKVRKICAEKSKKFKKDRPEHAEKYRQLYKKTLLLAAPSDFDSYCQYLEWNREANKRFYLPRRKQLKPVAEALQELALTCIWILKLMVFQLKSQELEEKKLLQVLKKW